EVDFGTLTLVNATLAGNSASEAGSGINDQFGTVKLYDSTLTGNLGGTGAILGEFGNGVTLSNSIVAGNYGTDLGVINSSLALDGNNILGSTPIVISSAETTNGSDTKIDGTSQAALATVFARVGDNPDTGILSGVPAKNSGPVETVAINPAGIAYN